MTSKILSQAIASGTLSGNSTDVVVSSNGAIQLAGNNTTDIFIAPNNNVGIGNTTPADALSVQGSLYTSSNTVTLGTGTYFVSNGSVGIGTSSPTSISGYNSLTINGSNSGLLSIKANGTDSGYIYANSTSFSIDSKASTPNLVLKTNGAERFRIDSTQGNISLNSNGYNYPWATSYQPGIDFGFQGYGSISCRADYSVYGQNIYMNGSGNWAYKIANQYGYSYVQSGGVHSWNTAANTGSANANAALTTLMYLDSSGNLITSGSSRAPIFYDQNNTGYYVDPASTTNINALTIGNGTITGLTATSATSFSTAGGSSENQLVVNYTGQDAAYMYNNSTNWGLYSVSGGSIIYWERSGSRTVLGGTYTSAAGSMRAPIFYDQDNTSYYIDPASTSDTASTHRGGMYFGPNSSWSEYLYVGSNGRPTDRASVCTTDGNLHLDCKSAHIMYLNYYSAGDVAIGNNGGILFSYQSTRSPIFYDSDDTAYYANLAGASRLSGIQSTGRSGNWNTDFQNTPADSFRYGGDLNAGTNGPTSGTGWWIQQNFRHSNNSNYWGVQVAWGWEDRANELYTRNVTGGSYGSWIRYWNSANAPGTVLQVVNTLKTDTFTSGTAETWIDVTGMSATITPKSSSSKIFVQIFVGRHYGTNSVVWRVLRNGSLFNAGASASNRQTVHGAESNQGRDGNHTGQFVIGYLDSPATTSAVTYQLQFRCESTNFTFNRNGIDSDITNSYSARSSSSVVLMEIAQ